MSLRIQASTMRVAVVAILAVALLIPAKNIVNAQTDPDAITISVSPQILDLTANPGETSTNTFRLTNASVEALQIETIPKNFTPRGEEGAVDLTEDTTSFSIAKWITVTPSKVTIEASKTQDFEVTIAVPQNAEPGSHFGSVVFKTVPPEQQGAGASVSQEIAPVILVKIAGDVTETAEIEEFTTDKSFYSNEKTIQFQSRIKNTGTAHFKPTGKITIKDTFGKEVQTLEIDKKNVLPDSIRLITTDWQFEGFKVGNYTATLTLVTGEEDEITVAETSFVIFPYQIVVPIGLGIAAIIALLYFGRKRIVRAARVLGGKDTEI